jgi:hypothetical protein
MNRLFIAFLFIFLLNVNYISFGQDAKFQSLIVYNLTKLLDWPNKNGNFTIRVIGNSELVKELKDFTVERKAGGKQDFDIQKIEKEEINQCNILFVGASECSSFDQIIKTVGAKPILVITEKPDFTSKGAAVCLVKEDGVWKFQYKEDNIKKLGVKVSMDFKELGIAK